MRRIRSSVERSGASRSGIRYAADPVIGVGQRLGQQRLARVEVVVDQRRRDPGVDRDPGDADVVDPLAGDPRDGRREDPLAGVRGPLPLGGAGAVLPVRPGGGDPGGDRSTALSGGGEVGADLRCEPADRSLALVQRAAAVAGRLQAALHGLDQLDVLVVDEVVDAVVEPADEAVAKRPPRGDATARRRRGCARVRRG